MWGCECVCVGGGAIGEEIRGRERAHEEHDGHEDASELAQQEEGGGGGHQALVGLQGGDGQVQGQGGETQGGGQGEGDAEPGRKHTCSH